MRYYLKDHVTDEMLQAVGFRLVFDEDIKAIKTLAHRSVFIDNDGEVLMWSKNDIQDLLDLDYVRLN